MGAALLDDRLGHLRALDYEINQTHKKRRSGGRRGQSKRGRQDDYSFDRPPPPPPSTGYKFHHTVLQAAHVVGMGRELIGVAASR